MFHKSIVLLFIIMSINSVSFAANPQEAAVTDNPYLTQAKQFYAAQNYKGMQEVLFKGLAEYPKSSEIFYNLGVAYYKLGRPKLAVRSYEQAIQLRPDFREARIGLASLYLDLKNYPKAMTQLKGLLKVDPTNPVIAEKLGLLYFNQKKYDEAATYFTKAIELSPTTTTQLYNYLGLTYYLTGQKAKALESLNKAKDLAALSDESHRLLAVLLLDEGRIEDAILELTSIIQSGKASADDYNNLGTAYSRQENYDSASRAFEKVLSLEPKHLVAIQNLGLAYIQLGQYEDAENNLRKLVRLQPTDSKAFYNLGFVQEQLQKYTAALNSYNKAKELGYADTAKIDQAIEYLSSKTSTSDQKTSE